MDTINSVGSLTAPLSMMMIGSSLAVYPIKDSFTDWRSYVFAFCSFNDCSFCNNDHVSFITH